MRHDGTETMADKPVFLNAHGVAMTRFGVRYLLQKYVAIAATAAPTLTGKRIHPHYLRHSPPNDQGRLAGLGRAQGLRFLLL